MLFTVLVLLLSAVAVGTTTQVVQAAQPPAASRLAVPAAHAAASAVPAAATAPTIAPKVPCAALVQDGFSTNSLVPDLSLLREAPTRITSATVVPATDSQPEYCDVKGYVQSASSSS